MMNILITAGPTREYIDPVRFISNASSGKMGYTLADAFVEKGARVRLIIGPVEQSKIENRKSKIKLTRVETAEQMRQAVLGNLEWADVLIMAAAIADYRPAQKAKQKIKKTEQTFNLKLEKTPDILNELGKQKRDGQTLVGFALETENLIDNAKRKLEEKNLDFVVANTEKAINSELADFFVIDRNKAKKYKNISKAAFAKELVGIIDSVATI